ncbi:hypothetical protein M3M35_06985 [Fructilactobacillus myrtifloralis]|uniref:Uncharacterized protein n=1 Tax=Fructilactobacillus myrtifloralis TaxID=2940301 RepID=A0ABY5BPP4_9LACO|nr:hypothetical protein [Fructilactobacillus myrtifloralis]USS85027.1 hypothetical protein M3M35_06985 [Fructilactobacillus myrtifloralis]
MIADSLIDLLLASESIIEVLIEALFEVALVEALSSLADFETKLSEADRLILMEVY